MTSIKVHTRPSDIIKDAVVKMDAVMAKYPFTDAKIKQAATDFVERYRNSRANSLGHTVGMEVHDVRNPTPTLEPGQIFTIEPAMQIRGRARGHPSGGHAADHRWRVREFVRIRARGGGGDREAHDQARAERCDDEAVEASLTWRPLGRPTDAMKLGLLVLASGAVFGPAGGSLSNLRGSLIAFAYDVQPRQQVSPFYSAA